MLTLNQYKSPDRVPPQSEKRATSDNLDLSLCERTYIVIASAQVSKRHCRYSSISWMSKMFIRVARCPEIELKLTLPELVLLAVRFSTVARPRWPPAFPFEYDSESRRGAEGNCHSRRVSACTTTVSPFLLPPLPEKIPLPRNVVSSPTVTLCSRRQN